MEWAQEDECSEDNCNGTDGLVGLGRDQCSVKDELWVDILVKVELLGDGRSMNVV